MTNSKKLWINSLLSKAVVFILVVFGVYTFISSRYGLDIDLIWHYLMGQDIVQTGHVSRVNSYSWITGTQWNQHEFLFDVIFYFVSHHLGIIGFHLMYISSVVLILILGYKQNKTRMESVWFYVVVSLLMMLLVPMCAPNRPSDFSTLLLPLSLLICKKKYKNKREAMIAKCGFGLFFGIFLSSFHCAQGIAILAMLILYLVISIVCNFIFKTKQDVSNYAEVFGFILSLFFGLQIYGMDLFLDVFKVLSMESTQYIQEWQQLPLTSYATVFVLMLCLLSLGYGLHNHKDGKTVTEVAMVCAPLMLTFVSAKSSILFVYMFIFYGYRYLEEMLFDMYYHITGNNVVLPKLGKGVSISAIVVGILISTLMVTEGEFQFEALVDKASSNTIGSDIMVHLQDSEYNLLHSYENGNFLMWNDVKVMVDTRQQPYAKENGFTETCDDVFYLMYHTNDGEAIERILDKYEIDAVLCSKTMDISWYLDCYTEFELFMIDEYENKLWIKK